MLNFLKKVVRKIPPFGGLYYQMERLEAENAKLHQQYSALIKKYESIQGVQDKIEEVLKESENVKNKCDAIVKGVEQNRNMVLDKEKSIYKHLGQINYELSKDIQYYYYKGLLPEQYEENLKEWYYNHTGEALDLENPRTYNEKIQWLKLYESTEQKANLTDKYLVRDYVKEKIGEEYLIPLLGVWARAEDIPFDELPEKYVLKANHGCGWNIIVRDQQSFNREDTKRRLNKWLQTDFAYCDGLELHYAMIHPRIIAEEYIENFNGEINDYKVFCFNGKAKYVMFITDRNTHKKIKFYDTDWNEMPFVYSYDRITEAVPKPENLSELICIAEKLAEGFTHVRVDFYRLNDGQYKFGEMTFSPTSGKACWNPPEYNRILGDLIELPKR